MDDLGFEMKSSGTNTNSKKSTLGSRVGLGSRVESKPKNLISYSVPFIPEPKSTTALNHIQLLNQGIDNYDLMMIFQDWSCKGNNLSLIHI